MYEGRRDQLQNIDELKERVKKVWKKAFTMAVLNNAILQFHLSLKAEVNENGGWYLRSYAIIGNVF